ncbi:MAG TPA: glycosyltransferase family 39 protein [Blastocatellia bacterium]|nr:glycosyltransferase family 39 protein [Blastocatellia bacterium]
MRERLLTFVREFATTRGIIFSTAALVLIFVSLALWQAYPFTDDVAAFDLTDDDWIVYKRNALNIIHGGLLIPDLQESYFAPAGFIYNYFIAAVFALTGENSTHVYITQAVLLALSAGLTTLAFKAHLPPEKLILYFGLLSVSFLLDVFPHYTFRLLSENLALFLLAVFCLALMRGFEKGSAVLITCAGVMLGLCALCRPNIALAAPVTALLLFLKIQNNRTGACLLFLLGFALTFSLLPLRNYAVAGELSAPIFTRTYYWCSPDNVDSAVPFYMKRVLFCFGWLSLESSGCRIRPHWLLMWIAAGVWTWRATKRRTLEFRQLFAVSFIAVYLIPVIVLSQISNYGFRFILPAIPMTLLLAVDAIQVEK